MLKDVIKEDSHLDENVVAIDCTTNQSFRENLQGNSLEKYNTFLSFVDKLKLSSLVRKKLSRDEDVYEIKVEFVDKNFVNKRFSKNIIKTRIQLKDLLQLVIKS